MLRFVARRFLYMVIAFLAASLVTFWLMKVSPGSFLMLNPATAQSSGMGGTALQIPPLEMQQLISYYHLGQPWYVQWWAYVQGFLTLHMGTSFSLAGGSILQQIGQRFPISLSLALVSIGVAAVVSIVLGTLAAIRENTWVDGTTMFVAVLGTAIPNYLVAIFLMIIFGVWLHWLPVVGFQGFQYWILPVLALALPMVSTMSRYMRNSLIESLHSEYIVAVFAKGGNLRQAVFGHAMRNSLLPFITVVGPHLAALMMGTVLIEQMFAIPGMGQLFVNAASTKDFPMIMYSSLLYCVVLFMMNFLIDLTYGWVDPRIRKRGFTV